MPPAATPPTAPPAGSAPGGVTIVESGKPAAPPPKPTSTIQVSTLPTTAEPPAPPKPGSAKERMFQSLRAKAKPAPEPPAGDTPPVKPATETTPPKVETETPEGETTPSETGTTAPVVPQTPEERKKANPWKIVDQYKARNADLEKQVAQAKTTALAETERKSLSERAETAEKHLKELKDELAFRDYTTSDDFKKNFQEPYEKAWQRAMGDLKELTITDENTGQSRPISAEDIVSLVNMPLAKAREQAEALFGPFANDVMGHRKEIRALYDAQASAIEDAKKTGAEKVKQRTEQLTKQLQETRDFIQQNWHAANEAAVNDPKSGRFFKPIDGDEEWNTRLQKGFTLVDQALNENPADPKHTPEQRAAIIKRHAAMRNRAAAFGPVRYRLEQAEARISELEAELASYKGTEPATIGQQGEAAPPATGSARESVMGALRKLAK